MNGSTAFDLVFEMYSKFLYQGIGKPESMKINKHLLLAIQREGGDFSKVVSDVQATDEQIVRMSRGDLTMTWRVYIPGVHEALIVDKEAL